jgi:hypothetical protein
MNGGENVEIKDLYLAGAEGKHVVTVSARHNLVMKDANSLAFSIFPKNEERERELLYGKLFQPSVSL